MAKKKKLKIEEEEVQAVEISGEKSPSMETFHAFISLSSIDQEKVVKLILESNGADHLLSVLNSDDYTGLGDFLADRVRYYHFFRVVKDKL
ncbi:MAG TPA: hypothetical protein VGB30_12495 [bacterium]|jgi:hypothetical protein